MNTSRRGEAGFEEGREILTAPEWSVILHSSDKSSLWTSGCSAGIESSPAPPPEGREGPVLKHSSDGNWASCWDTGKITATAKRNSKGDASSKVSPCIISYICYLESVMLWTYSPHGHLDKCIAVGEKKSPKNLKAFKWSRHWVLMVPAGRCLQHCASRNAALIHHWGTSTTVLFVKPLTCTLSFLPPQESLQALGALMRSSALKKWSVISLHFPLVPTEWEQEAASILLTNRVNNKFRCGGWMSHLIPAIKLCNRIQMQNKDQLT